MEIPTTFTFSQNIFRSIYPEIIVSACDEDDMQEFLPTFFETIDDGVIGIAPFYVGKCRLEKIAIASKTHVLIVTPTRSRKASSKKRLLALRPNQSLRSLLCHPKISKCAFQMDKLAAALFLDFDIRITSGKDLLSLAKGDRLSLQSFVSVLGGENNVKKHSVKNLCDSEDVSRADLQTLALQAWAASASAILSDISIQLQMAPSIDTNTLDSVSLGLVSRTIRNGSLLLALKPTRVKNEVTVGTATRSGEVSVTSERYKTRVRPSGNQNTHAPLQQITLSATSSDGTISAYTGRTTEVTGRLATLSINGDVSALKVHSVETVGRPRMTVSEALRQRILLGILQKMISLDTYPFVSAIFSDKKPSWDGTLRLSPSPEFYFPTDRILNDSQANAVNAILSDDDENRVVVIHGPPGTGKTTVIAASVTSIMDDEDTDRTMWLLAASNVAVKNIAEKLAAVDFLDFKIIVTKEFHFDWHEHLYTRIESNLIRSDDLILDRVATERQLGGSRVILCTLSMLSNDRLDEIAQQVHPDTVIIDEASQIEVGDFLPMIVRFRSTLRQLVFVGDDKQHRMPIPLGDFISKHVYDDMLKSEHLISHPECCSFVDVEDGLEVFQENSYRNIREAAVAVAIAQQLTNAGKSFRIITPYDSQRSLLENSLKHAKVPWEDKCFNVDSFQGNEDDYIVISLVRSDRLGFLKEMQRVNVMLTRCKKGMIICTSRKFLEGPAADSLVGTLRKSFHHLAWLDGRQVQFGGLKAFS
ncbi:P-loop containing nucleoside triphosphate hydrolase protein [Pholiota conissans]|uniref:P-loop containing nucleoside triphosphate hydrolase protein n=1 Tax=Pholiota conissans TaxID=109636 RepID=A0A9P5ZCG2_9AGAR|nr:P-loop containing nucleoside triphosphate hydrolase protein [Pholiota conissans]